MWIAWQITISEIGGSAKINEEEFFLHILHFLYLFWFHILKEIEAAVILLIILSITITNVTILFEAS